MIQTRAWPHLTCANKYLIFLIIRYKQENCIPLCPLECNRTNFDYSVTEVDIMGETLVNYINEKKNLLSDFVTKKPTTSSIKQSVVRLSIFTESLSYTFSWERPKVDASDVIANVGGHCGLFLNIGFFSLCEILSILIQIFYIFREKRIHSKNSQTT